MQICIGVLGAMRIEPSAKARRPSPGRRRQKGSKTGRPPGPRPGHRIKSARLIAWSLKISPSGKSCHGQVSETTDLEDLISLNRAVYLVGDEERPVDQSAIRAAARRLNALKRDSKGRLAVPRSTLLAMRECYRLTGWLAPRKSALTTPWPESPGVAA
jgi:hypothetical protein